MPSPHFLIRNTLFDTGELPPTDCTVQFSPDIICMQNKVLTFAEAEATYGRQIGLPALQHQKTRIYVRAVNNTEKAQDGEVRLFCRPFNELYTPSEWIPLHLESDSGSREYVQTLRQSGGVVPQPGTKVLGVFAFVFWAEVSSCNCYGLFAQTRTLEESWTEPPKSWKDDAELWAYLRSHPEAGLTGVTVL